MPPETKIKLLFRLARFYRGFHLFGFTQILFIAFEFSFYESQMKLYERLLSGSMMENFKNDLHHACNSSKIVQKYEMASKYVSEKLNYAASTHSL